MSWVCSPVGINPNLLEPFGVLGLVQSDRLTIFALGNLGSRLGKVQRFPGAIGKLL